MIQINGTVVLPASPHEEPGGVGMKVLLFGKLADKAGREIEVDLPEAGCTVAELRDRLCRERPGLAADLSSPAIKACIDQQMAAEEALVLPGHEVAFIPPLSGG